MHVIDSHTGGEPTRVILTGGPDLGSGSLADRAARLAQDHQPFCRAVCAEPRGQVAMVCALLVPPVDPACVAGVIFFDAAAVLGMCGHGTIGLAVTLFHLGQIGPGRHLIETPVGVVAVDVADAHTVAVTNVESRRLHQGLTVAVDGFGVGTQHITGDVAYGGNHFFLVDPSPIPVAPDNIRQLTDLTVALRAAVLAQGIMVDHVILYGPAVSPAAHSRNFVLCPDDSYDRSPCGTGCSARLACLAADGRLAEGDEIVQESIIGSSYRLSWRQGAAGGVIPLITGQAFVMADSTLIFDPADPFKDGISA
ncbi:proline racemase family protein [Pseudotabrizicola alkalilacus]|uniref:Hydroxyproline-2-epimerase n=1 Tax=Pseudotabrizicola alkalilacus TaxID=2305252 RepID=A0A411YZN7_9RHOB|nr:proline racemase family protein [Pseudotabrizicola alkalilacus]RGP36279.1 hydroxyproline-2-epimerase [Pseudotabrizicola alkalilacus]